MRYVNIKNVSLVPCQPLPRWNLEAIYPVNGLVSLRVSRRSLTATAVSRPLRTCHVTLSWLSPHPSEQRGAYDAHEV